MNRESLDKFCERAILGLVLLIVVFTPLAFGGRSQPAAGSALDFILVNPFNIVEWLTVGVMACWGLRLWVHPSPKLLWPPVCWPVVAFALYAVVRYLTADIEYVARTEMIQVLVYAFLFLAIVNNLQRQESAQRITLVLVFLAMAVSIYAACQFLTGSTKVWNLVTPYRHRATGTFISPNNLGAFLEMILPLGLAYTLLSRVKALGKVFTGYASLVILTAIAMTGSRGTWIATTLALMLFFAVLLLNHAHRLPALALLTLIVVGALYFGPRDVFLRLRLQSIKTPSGEISDDGRFGIWRAAVKLWQEDPWWGIGPGHFDYRFGKYRPPLVQTSPDRAHNDYLNTLTDWGIVGVTIVTTAFVLLFSCAIWTWRFVRRSPDKLGDHRSNKATIVLGAAIGLVAILIHSFVDFNMHIPANAILAVTLMALLTCYLRFATDRYWLTARVGIKSLVTAVLATGLVYLSWQGVRSAGESVWLMRAQQAEPASPEQIAALQKAFAIEPKNFETARAIGEDHRLLSWQNNDDYKEQALEAMKWFKRAMELNPYDDASVLRYAMCLDQIGEHDQAFEYFDRANRIDPNSYFDNAYMGWHYVQTGDYAAARVWLERSHTLEWTDNPVADTYLKIAENRMLEAATNSASLQLRLASPTKEFQLPPWNKN